MPVEYNSPHMVTVAIIGAGELGGAIAQALAARDRVARVLLVDVAGSVAAGKALDVQQMGAVDRLSHARSRAPTIRAVWLAAPPASLPTDLAPASSEWQGEDGLAMLTRLAPYLGDAPIVFAGAFQANLLLAAVRDVRIPRRRAIGSSPEAFGSAVAAIVAMEARCSPTEVALTCARGAGPFRRALERGVDWGPCAGAGPFPGRAQPPPGPDGEAVAARRRRRWALPPRGSRRRCSSPRDGRTACSPSSAANSTSKTGWGRCLSCSPPHGIAHTRVPVAEHARTRAARDALWQVRIHVNAQAARPGIPVRGGARGRRSRRTPEIQPDAAARHIKFLAVGRLCRDAATARRGSSGRRTTSPSSSRQRGCGRPAPNGDWFQPFELQAGLTAGEGNELVIETRGQTVRLSLGSGYYPLAATADESSAIAVCRPRQPAARLRGIRDLAHRR